MKHLVLEKTSFPKKIYEFYNDYRCSKLIYYLHKTLIYFYNTYVNESNAFYFKLVLYQYNHNTN